MPVSMPLKAQVAIRFIPSHALNHCHLRHESSCGIDQNFSPQHPFRVKKLKVIHDLVDELARIAEIARKQGPVGLEKVEADEPFLAKGIRYVADGYDLEFIRDNLERDRDNFLMHLDEGSKIYRAIGDCAPAFGMIGTLVGMVQMFANMTDPSKLGPFMATALLATLYGALVANLFCLPIADKLHGKLLDEETNRTLIIDGILMIRDSKSPALVREMLLAYLPEKHRHEEGEPVPA